MEFQVSARKWRPQKFSELIGQEHIVRTLHNAIDMDRVAHAYLFSGTRGVGKTTTARTILRALNPTGGEVWFRSQQMGEVDLATLTEKQLKPLRTEMQMIFQDPFGSLKPLDRVITAELAPNLQAMTNRSGDFPSGSAVR